VSAKKERGDGLVMTRDGSLEVPAMEEEARRALDTMVGRYVILSGQLAQSEIGGERWRAKMFAEFSDAANELSANIDMMIRALNEWADDDDDDRGDDALEAVQ
jgi:hypothetical protein